MGWTRNWAYEISAALMRRYDDLTMGRERLQVPIYYNHKEARAWRNGYTYAMNDAAQTAAHFVRKQEEEGE